MSRSKPDRPSEEINECIFHFSAGSGKLKIEKRRDVIGKIYFNISCAHEALWIASTQGKLYKLIYIENKCHAKYILIWSWKDKHQPLNTICGLHYGFLAPIHNLFPAATISKIYEDLESTEGLKKLLEFCLLAYSLSLINNWWTICEKHMD